VSSSISSRLKYIFHLSRPPLAYLFTVFTTLVHCFCRCNCKGKVTLSSLSSFPGTEWTEDDAEGLWSLVDDKMLYAKVMIYTELYLYWIALSVLNCSL
jgi:hypothetical protein